MKTKVFSLVFVLLTTAVAGRFFAQTARLQSPVTSPETEQALVSQYCAGCHNDNLKSGGFSWTTIDLTHPEKNAERVEKVIRKLRAGLMPPPGRPRPETSVIKGFATDLESRIDKAALDKPYVGRPLLHHLNRAEYAASIQDLLGLSIDVNSLLPPDVMSHGFDNMADVLTTSPALLEAYIRAASKVSRLAVGDTELQPEVATFLLSKDVSQTRHVPGAPMGTRGGLSVIHNFPVEGDYVFKLGFYYSVDGPLFGKIQGRGQQIEVSINGERVSLFSLDPNRTKWHDMETPPVHVEAGTQRVSAAFLETFEGPVEDVILPMEQTLVDLNEADMAGLTSLPHLHDFEIRGPMKVLGSGDTLSRRKIFSCHPADARDEAACARTIISRLLPQAYRRPVSNSEIDELMSLYQSSRDEGGFESGIRMAIQAILSDPQFVFQLERAPSNVTPGTSYRISDLELASRLSYFLWSSAPDEELLSIAASGKLRDPATLEKQTHRMLADPRSIALTNNFASQWLHLRNLKDVQPDAYQFLDYTKNLGNSMMRETQLFFDSIVREDRNILDLLTADYTFVDEPLGRHYGIPNISGSNFRRVQIPDKNRRGILGQASVLTLTSVSTRTSPVGRGKYVMEVLLGTPPPAPPPNVPPLKETAVSGDTKMLSVRQRMEEHRSVEPCASCHKLMDPIGFALENFDAVGAWRINDGGFRIDPTGQLFDGTKLDGPPSLNQAILNHQDLFLSAFGENLMAYGLGRVVDYRDMPVLRSIINDAAKGGNRFSSFVLALVNSAPFQMSVAEASEH
jgi:cytochrome c551/c552